MPKNNIEIFKDTEQLCQTNPTLMAAIKASNAGQKIYLEGEAINCDKQRFNEKAQIIVSKKRSFSAARAYKGQAVAVLNFASAANPGAYAILRRRLEREMGKRITCLCFIE